MNNKKNDLLTINDEEIETGYLEAVKRDNFAKGVAVLYKVNEGDELYTLEQPDGTKEYLSHDDLVALNKEIYARNPTRPVG